MVLHHFEIDGGTLAVEVEGNGPLVVCAPGMGDFRDSYAPFAAQLIAQGYMVARMDPRGHGDSSVTFNHYGDEATADDFVMVVEKLGKGPAVLAGCSFGGGAAVIAAGKRPDLVSGLILLAPFLRNGMGVWGLYLVRLLFMWPWGPWIWEMYAKTLWPGLGDAAGVRATASKVSLTRPGLGEAAGVRATASKVSLTRPGRWTGFSNTIWGIDHREVTPWIDHVQAPALVVMGDKDPDWPNPVKEAEWVASNFREVDSMIVQGVGHAPMLERVDMVGERTLGFLGGLRSKGVLR
jgi:pimeloyl-ACP methyl ester carboxylesterase